MHGFRSQGRHSPGGLTRSQRLPAAFVERATEVDARYRDSRALNVLIAPDKFKGSLTALQVTNALSEGLNAAAPELQLHGHPVADGGDGFVHELIAHGYQLHDVSTWDALGRPTVAQYATKDLTAVIELASASGIGKLADTALLPLDADTWGTGEVISQAIAAGNRRIIVGTGGSASSDGGAGLLAALGARALDAHGAAIDRCGAAGLESIRSLDLSDLTRRLAGVEFRVAADVFNPLLGPRGAATVFAPQKGADERDVRQIERALTHWSSLLESATGRHCRAQSGAGAAGGAAFAIASAVGAEIDRGFDVYAELTGLERAVSVADVVLTGEGCLDRQSLEGKAPVGVLDLGIKYQTPVWAVVGQTLLEPHEIQRRGFVGCVALSDLEPDVERSMDSAFELLTAIGKKLAWRIVSDARAQAGSVSRA